MKKIKNLVSWLIIASMSLSLCIPMAAFAKATDETTIKNEVIEIDNLSTSKAPNGYVPQNSYIENDDSVKLFSEAETPRVLLVEDVLPWDSNANQVVLNQLTEYDKVTTSQFLTVDLSKYGVIVFANDQPFNTYENYKEFKEYMELFASIGGVIVFGACDAGWANGQLVEKLPGDVSKKTHYVYNNYVVDDTHPIVSGSLIDNEELKTSDLQSTYCSHVSFDENSLPAGSKIILREKDSDRPTLVEYPLGKGRVIASGLTWEHNWYHAGNTYNGVKIEYFAKIAMADMFKYAIRVSSINVDDVHVLKEYYMSKNAHYVVVANKNAAAIKGATVTIDGNNYITDENGMAIYNGSYGVKEIKVSADGYRDSSQYYNLQPRQSRNVFLETAKDDEKPYVTMVADTETFFDVRYQTKRFEKGDGKVLSLRVSANWAEASDGKYIIYQEGVAGGAVGKSITSDNGIFSFAPGKVLNSEQQVKLKLVANNGMESEPINLNIIIDEVIDYGESENGGKGLENITSIKLSEDKKGTINDSNATAVFPGDFSLKISSLPLKIKKSINDDGSITWKGTIGIGKSNYLDNDATWESFKNDFDTACKNADRTDKLADLMSSFGAVGGSFTIEKKLLSPKISSVGYIEVIQDKNGNTIESNGGIIVTGSNTSTLSNQFMAGPVPIYIDLTGKVNVDMQFGLGYDFTKEDWIYDGELGIGGSIALGGGLGVSGVATIGVEGSASIDIKLHPKNQGNATLAANIKAYLLWVFDWNYPIAEKTYHLWGHNEKISLMSLDNIENAYNDISLSSREYNKRTSSWQGQSVSLMNLDDNSENFVTLQEYIMPNTLPELIEIDDSYILLFHTDNSEKSNGNNVVLMYSVYDDDTNTWLEPKAVSEGVSSDLYVKSFVYNNELYIVWQKVKTELTSIDANALLGEMSANIDISFAKWNKATNSFDQTYVNTDDNLDMYPNLAINDDKITAVWVSNSANDAKGETGTYTVMTSDLSDGSWSAPNVVFKTNDYITELSAGYVDENLEILYAINSENASGNIYEISNNKSNLVTGQTSIGSSLIFDDGYFYWAENGTILQYDASENAINLIQSGSESVIMPSYKIVENKTDTAVVWVANSINGGSEVYASIKGEKNWSNPIVLLENQEYNIHYMDAKLDNDGTWKLVLNTQETIDGEEKSSIVYANIDAQTDTSLNYVNIDEKKRTDGKQPILINISNNGQNIVDKLIVEIKDLNGNTYFDETIECSILPGENKNATMEIDLLGLRSNTELEICAYVENEMDVDDNVLTETVGCVDVFLSLAQYTVEDNLILSATVTNDSDIPANTAISIIEDSKDGIVLDMKNIGILTEENSYVYLYSIDRSAINYSGKDHKYYYITLSTLEEDINEYNNTEIVTVYPKTVNEPNNAPIEEVEIINVTGITTPEFLEIKMSDDIVSEQLTAVVMPENATNKDVEWISDNEDVAIVNQNGVITALSTGTANITATTLDGDYSSTTVVNVITENKPKYTLTLGAVSNGSISASSTSCIEGQIISLSAKPDNGYNFKAWSSSNGGIFTDTNASLTTFTMPANDTTIIATFEKQLTLQTGGGGVPAYMIKFDTNGAGAINSQYIKKNEIVIEPTAPEKEGYIFNGWYTDKELTKKYDFTSKVSKGFTLYAKWVEIANEEAENHNTTESDITENVFFNDVNENDWFYTSVKYAVDNKLMNGVAEKIFAPNEPLTRAMLVTILYRNEGESDINASIPFYDIDVNNYHADAVIWAQQTGIVKGITGTRFAPDNNITREQIATIIYRYAQYKGYDVSVGETVNIFAYDDALNVSEYANEAMKYAVGSGIIKGKSATTLNPLDNATRAEIAAILQRFIEANK